MPIFHSSPFYLVTSNNIITILLCCNCCTQWIDERMKNESKPASKKTKIKKLPTLSWLTQHSINIRAYKYPFSKHREANTSIYLLVCIVGHKAMHPCDAYTKGEEEEEEEEREKEEIEKANKIASDRLKRKFVVNFLSSISCIIFSLALSCLY